MSLQNILTDKTEGVGQLSACAQVCVCVCLYTTLREGWCFTDVFRDCSTALNGGLSSDVEVVNRMVNRVEMWS